MHQVISSSLDHANRKRSTSISSSFPLYICVQRRCLWEPSCDSYSSLLKPFNLELCDHRRTIIVRVTFESIITTGNGQAGNFTEMHNHNCFYIETFMTCNSLAFHVFLSWQAREEDKQFSTGSETAWKMSWISCPNAMPYRFNGAVS